MTRKKGFHSKQESWVKILKITNQTRTVVDSNTVVKKKNLRNKDQELLKLNLLPSALPTNTHTSTPCPPGAVRNRSTKNVIWFRDSKIRKGLQFSLRANCWGCYSMLVVEDGKTWEKEDRNSRTKKKLNFSPYRINNTY